MRAGPLSNPRVIDLLNSRFVPVYVSNEDYTGDGPAPAVERAQRDRINREALAAGLSAGTVHAFVLAPDGRVVDSLHVAQAARVEETRAMLDRAVEKFQPRPGDPLVKPTAQSRPPQVDPGGVVLHLTARYLQPDGDNPLDLGELGLGESRNASWSAFAAENWIAFSAADVNKLLPTGGVAVGAAWDVEPGLAARVLVFCYPSTECNDPARNRIDEQQLRAEVVSVKDGLARARLSGRLRMRHHFYPGREDDNSVDATFVGYVDFDPAGRRIQTLRLVTDRATYARQTFGVAIQSISAK
jgi:hypothetical protein